MLDVIARRVQGPTRGQILLNNQPMSLALFQQRCGYVTHKCDFLPGLTVEETLFFTPTKVLAHTSLLNIQITLNFAFFIDKWLFKKIKS